MTTFNYIILTASFIQMILAVHLLFEKNYENSNLKEENIIERKINDSFYINDKFLYQNKYFVSGEYKIINKLKREFEITIKTNIPGKVIAAVTIEKSAMKPNDNYIGTDMQKVNLLNGIGKFQFKATNYDGKSLPNGKYVLVIEIYKWGLVDEKAKKTNISKELKFTSHEFTLTGNDINQNEVANFEEKESWLMNHFVVGEKWDPELYIEKLGTFSEIELSKINVDLNPQIIKGYYFKSIDYVVIVNTLKNITVTYKKM